MEGLAQEALGRPADAIESYRAAVSRGTAPEAAERLAALERAAAVAARPADAVRQ